MKLVRLWKPACECKKGEKGYGQYRWRHSIGRLRDIGENPGIIAGVRSNFSNWLG
jgi:hypothetical protein